MSAPRVFINYAREDKKHANDLHRRLKKEGFEPWMDIDIIPGSDWRARIDKAIRQADFFLALLSKRSIEKTGVIEEEINYARQLRSSDPDGGIFLIPVRLDDVTVPESISNLQWVDLFEPGGWPRLLQALWSKGRPEPPPWHRRYTTVIAVAALLLVVGVVFWITRTNEAERFQEARRTGRPPSDRARIGITFFECRDSVDSDPTGIRMLVEAQSGGDRYCTPVRRDSETVFEEDALVRIALETNFPGFLYITDEEQRTGGKAGEFRLLFPTEGTLVSGNKMQPGRVVTIPSAHSSAGFWKAERLAHDYRGELLTVIVAAHPMPELENFGTAGGWSRDKLKEFIDHWRGRAQRVFDSKSDAPITPAEAEAAASSTRMLTENEPAPQTIFGASMTDDGPALVQLPIRIAAANKK